MRILVVEDDPMSRDLVAGALRHGGHEVTTACDGHEALAALRAGTIRLVVSDWSMPGMDGADLCRAIRATAAHDVYVILLTGRGAAARFDGLHAGADDYLDKPLDVTDLLASVRAGERVLAGAATAAARPKPAVRKSA